MSKSEVDVRIQHYLAAGDVRSAVSTTLRHYGPEILTFLSALTKDVDSASDVFSSFCEDVWSGLPGFRWESSLRTWLYVIARRTRLKHAQQGYERRRRPLDDQLLEVQEAVRTQTATFQRTETKSKVRLLRSELSAEEQTLLMLRVDRSLAWTDIAKIMLSDDQADETSLKREAAACRKRFERAKEHLRELARAHGLLKEPE